MSNETAHLFVECDMECPQLLPLAGYMIAAYAHRCPGKETPNEDCMAIISAGPKSGILVIADGMGGAKAGQQASAIAVESLKAAISAASSDRSDLRAAVLDGIEQANRSVLKLGVGAGTTLSVVEINENVIRSYHVGDSMILLVGQRGKIKLETIPHSPVGHAIEAGVIDEDEAMHHDERHIVTNFVGTEEMRIEIGPPIRISAKDTLILASDGLSDNLETRIIVETIRCGDLARQTQLLIDQARQRMQMPVESSLASKPDDLTVLVLRTS